MPKTPCVSCVQEITHQPMWSANIAIGYKLIAAAGCNGVSYITMRFTPFLIPLAASLNILLSSSDSWVSKNARFLHKALKEEGHNVLYVGPLDSPSELPPLDLIGHDESVERRSGGDFDHLLPSNQKYYKQKREQKVPRGAKNVIYKRDAKAYDDADQQVVNQESLGQDPLNKDFWYVEGSGLQAISVAFTVILPLYYPNFKPDMVLIGPNEGLHLSTSTLQDEVIMSEDLTTKENVVEAMTQYAQVQNVPVIAVSTEDHHHVYYEDEEMFNAEESLYSKHFKSNPISKNVRFVNDRIVELIAKVGQRLSEHLALNINFPSMNHAHSQCTTNGKKGPEFTQVVRSHSSTGAFGKILAIPKFFMKDNNLVSGKKLYMKVSEDLGTSEEVTPVESMRLSSLIPRHVQKEVSDNEDLNLLYSNSEELKALENCQIAVSVNHVIKGNNLDTNVLSVARLLA